MEITVCVLRDDWCGWGQVCALLRVCFAFLLPLPFKVWRKLCSPCPVVQPWAGPGRLLSISEIKSTFSHPVSHTPRGETTADDLLPAPVWSLYDTLLITAMTGPLSQRMPPSFCWSHMFAESCLEVLRLDPEQRVWHFGPSFELELCRISPCLLGRWKRWAGPICHSVLSPSSRRRNFLKSYLNSPALCLIF